MCGRGRGIARKFKKRNGDEIDDGFESWGGYMAAKRAKLLDQFQNESIKKVSNIFAGVRIMVNGLTHPSASELKSLMSAHGGEFHMYQGASTTHIIASNLPNVKIKHLGAVPIVKPQWITESIALNKLLDYKRYLLYSNQTKSQPALSFTVVQQPCTLKENDNKDSSNLDSGISPKNVKEFIDAREDQPISTTNQKADVSNSSLLPPKPSMSNAPINFDNFKATKSSTVTKITKTASDPRFLEEFYSNSRLHLIATLGAEFKQLVGQLREKSNGKFPGKEKLIAERDISSATYSVPSSIIMHIDMDCFFVSVGLRNHPELKGKPVAITHAKSGVINTNDPKRQAARTKEFELYQERLPEGVTSRVVDIKDQIDGLASMSEIASCSYEARKYGIKNGMFLGQAVKLCPELKTLSYDFEGYKEVSNTLYNIVASYTLNIEAVSCDEMYVDIKQLLLDTGLTVDEWAAHIRKEIMSATGCPCSTGFGANKLQARLATRKAKPASQYYLKPENVEKYMAEIPLSDLPGVGRATLAKLTALGLTTCGDVQIASIKILRAELGTKLGEKIREQSFGKDNKPLDYNHERKSVSAEINYGIRFKTKEECYKFLQSLSNEVFNRLNDVNMRARGLTLKLLVRAEGAPIETAKFLGHGVCDAINKSSPSNILYSSPEIIYKEAKLVYEKLNINYNELRGVGIQLTKLEKEAPVNKALKRFLNQGVFKPPIAANNISDATKKPSESVTVISSLDNVESVSKEKQKESQQLQTSDSDNNKFITINTTELSTNQTKSHDIQAAAESINQETSKCSIDNSSVKPKRRGRPKGSKNETSQQINKNNYAIRTYLEKYNSKGDKTNSESAEPDDELFKESKSKEDIDVNVLNELPEDLRKEIIREYHFSQKPQQFHNPQFITEPSRSAEVTKKDNSRTKKTHVKKYSPFTNLSWDQIKHIVKAWIRCEKTPLKVDIQMLGYHMKQLAIKRKIEELQRGFNFLYRLFSNMDCTWHEAYFIILNATQKGMIAAYGKKLLLKDNFMCSNNCNIKKK